MQVTHPNKIHSQICSQIWISIFKWSHLPCILEQSEPHDTHRRPEAGTSGLSLATAHCPAPTLCLILSAAYSISLITYIWAPMRFLSLAQCLDSIFCWECLPHHIAHQTHPFFETQLVPHCHQEAPRVLVWNYCHLLDAFCAPGIHLIYTWPQHSAQCPTHTVKSKNNYTQMKCYWFCIFSPKFTALSRLREIKCLA